MSITLKKADGDIVISESNGRPYYVSGVEKLTQEVADSLMTIYDPEYDFGHELDTAIGNNKRLSFLNVINATYIRNRVEEAIARLKDLQKSRPDQIDDYEAVDEIVDLKVYPMGKTGYAFIVQVAPLAGPNVAPQSFSVKLSHQLLPTARKDFSGGVFDDNRS